MIKKSKNPIKRYFDEIRYKVVRLKYFVLVVAAMFLEIVVLIIYLLSNEKILKIDFFNLEYLFGFTSAVIIIISVGIIVLLKLDRTKDRNMLTQYRTFKKKYYEVTNSHMTGINRTIREFDKEMGDVEHKIELAITIANLYQYLVDDFEKIDVPEFLKEAYEKEKEHFIKEQAFFDRFASFEDSESLHSISNDSEDLHSNFLKEINKIENNLKLVM